MQDRSPKPRTPRRPGVSHSQEFLLVAACCRWPDDGARHAAIRAAAVPEIDWRRVDRIAARQRVRGLLANGLRSAGVETPLAAEMHAEEVRLVRANLGLSAECLRVDGALTGAGIDALHVKGIPLALQAYGTASVKMSLDIDVLVAQADVARACAVLAALGYERISPGAEVDDDRVPEWVRLMKETSWVHRGRRTMVDLHGRLLDNPALAPAIGVASPRERVTIAPGRSLPTLARDPLYAYLCAHGAQHGWSRLKWLADLAALIGGCGPEEIARLHDVAERLGVGRCSAQGLLLCRQLLGTPIGDALEARLLADGVNRVLARLALATTNGRYESEPHRHDTLGGSPVLMSHFLLRRGLAHKAAELRGKLAFPRDRVLGRLPPSLSFLYPAFGVMRCAARRMGIGGARRQGEG